MFGYIRPFIPELRVAEYEYYRAVYCGVCRQMGRICGSASRLSLSYDQAFFALVRAAVTGEIPVTEKRHCAANPLKKCRMAAKSPSVDLAAAVGAVLAAYKFGDDAEDERGFRRAAARIAYRGAAPWMRRAEKKYPGLCDGIGERLRDYYDSERENCGDDVSVDRAADAFGKVLEFIMSYGLEGERAAVTGAFGRHIGRWIYCVDAVDDMDEDKKRGRNNVFLSAYGNRTLGNDEKKTLSCLLAAETAAAEDILELADPAQGTALDIVHNILLEGMAHTADAVLSGTYRKPHRHDYGYRTENPETYQRKEDTTDGIQ